MRQDRRLGKCEARCRCGWLLGHARPMMTGRDGCLLVFASAGAFLRPLGGTFPALGNGFGYYWCSQEGEYLSAATVHGGDRRQGLGLVG